MERYSEYKDSGVKWLGEIPSHWEVKRLGKICSFSKGLQFTKADLVEDGVPVVSYGQVHAKYNSRTHLSNDLIRYVPGDIAYGNENSKVGIGDFIVADTSEDVDGCGNMAFNDCRTDLYGGYHTILIKNLQIQNQKFLAYLFNSHTWRAQVRNLVNGVKVYTINRDILKSSYVIIPPNKEQNVIVDYLDSAVSVIDNAIAQQQKMIDLLNERKQIIINDAVTKGLDPKAKMKDSGIDWIGQIPEHWETIQLKKYAKIILGKMLSNLQNNETEYICAKDVHYGNIDISDLKKMNFSKSEKEMYEVKKGDLLIVEGGAGAGGCAIYNYEKTGICIQNSIMIVRCNEKIINEYVCFFLQSINEKGYVEYVCNKATIPHFTKEKVGSVTIPVPSRTEQLEIVKYVKNNISPINLAIESANKQIALLQERKQIIINDVVTGKVKV